MLFHVLVFALVILSVILHEIAHGYVAELRGDSTARMAGRLTLNPLAHVDPFGTIILPALLMFTGAPVIGWAKPVPVNPGRMMNPRSDWMLVSLAGPLTNIIIGFLFLLPVKFGFAPLDTFGGDLCLTLFLTNLYLALFNLIPIPPLDGSRVLMRYLSYPAIEKLAILEGPMGMILIYVLLMTGVIDKLLDPLVGLILRGIGIL